MLSDTLNKEFCKECGIKQATCYILNTETNEVRFYKKLSGTKKKPIGWKNTEIYKFNKPKYPDLINNPYNFLTLLNIQWDMFGEVGEIYKKNGKEPFEYNYLKTRLSAIKMCKSFGGGEMLDEYKKAIQTAPFNYIDDEDDAEEVKE